VLVRRDAAHGGAHGARAAEPARRAARPLRAQGASRGRTAPVAHTHAGERAALTPRRAPFSRPQAPRPGSRGTSPAPQGALSFGDAPLHGSSSSNNATSSGAVAGSLSSDYARQLGECMRQFNLSRSSVGGINAAAPAQPRTSAPGAARRGISGISGTGPFTVCVCVDACVRVCRAGALGADAPARAVEEANARAQRAAGDAARAAPAASATAAALSQLAQPRATATAATQPPPSPQRPPASPRHHAHIMGSPPGGAGRRERNAAADAAAAALARALTHASLPPSTHSSHAPVRVPRPRPHTQAPVDLMSRMDLAGGLTSRGGGRDAPEASSGGPLAAEVRSLSAAHAAEASAARARERTLAAELAAAREAAAAAQAALAAERRAAADAAAAATAQAARLSAALEERRAEAKALHDALAAAAAAHAQRCGELTRRAAAAEADAAAARAQLAAATAAAASAPASAQAAEQAQPAAAAAQTASAAASAHPATFAAAAAAGAASTAAAGAAASAAASAAAAALRSAGGSARPTTAPASSAAAASPARSSRRRSGGGGTPGSASRRATAAAAAAANASAANVPSPGTSARRSLEVHKLRGNAAFHVGRYENALAEYTAGLTAALSAPHGSAAAASLRPARAVLHSNRAAALQASGKLLDAVADCAMALALDPAYTRARQRRADALHALGDTAGAARDLEALASCASSAAEAAALRARAAAAAAAARRPGAAGPDHYAVLGVAPAADAAAIKAAYRAAALRHHPDKASPEGGAPVRAAAEALFKMAATAYAVLTDVALRRRYDAQRTLAAATEAGAAVYAR
jgi:DnaJ-domain-containing protein 1